jgi:hypothetical protein
LKHPYSSSATCCVRDFDAVVDVETRLGIHCFHNHLLLIMNNSTPVLSEVPRINPLLFMLLEYQGM